MKADILNVINHAYNEYYRCKYLAKIFRKNKKYNKALSYYHLASIHLYYYKQLNKKGHEINNI